MPSPEPAAAGARPVTLPVGTAVRLATARLTEAGCDTPRLDAELLLAEVLGVGRERLVIDDRELVPPDAHKRFGELVVRRAEHEPVAYLLGRREFRRISVLCDRRALIPRPETELLVEVGLTLPSGARVLDVGTGTGAIALALADERPDLTIAAVDASPGALALARENAARLGLTSVRFVLGDLRAGIECDALLANLPYVRAGDALPADVARYEPGEALYAGGDGLDLIRRLTADLDGVGLVALEHGCDQAPAVGSLLRAAGFGSVEVLRDLAGHERVTVGRR